MSGKLKPVKIGKDGQLYVDDDSPNFNNLNGDSIKWDDDAHYRSLLSFAMAVGDFLNNIGDMEFINTLPMSMEEFHQLAFLKKDKYVNIIKAQYAHFEDMGDEVVTGEGADKLDKYHQASLDSIKRDCVDEIKDLKSSLLKGVVDQTSAQPSPPTTAPVIDNEAVVRTNKIKELSAKVKAQALIIKSGRPDGMQMKHIIDSCRKLNGKCNNEAVGRKLGIDGETAKSWIEDLQLSEYAYNPKHLK